MDNAIGWALVAGMFAIVALALTLPVVATIGAFDRAFGDKPAECQARKDAGALE